MFKWTLVAIGTFAILAALLVSLTGMSLAVEKGTAEADPGPASRPLVRIDHIPLVARDRPRPRACARPHRSQRPVSVANVASAATHRGLDDLHLPR